MTKTKSNKVNTSKETIPKKRIENAVKSIEKYLKDKKIEISERNQKVLLEDDEEELLDSLQLIAINNKTFTGTPNKLIFKPLLLPVENSLYSKWLKASVDLPKDFQTLLILKENDAEKLNLDIDNEESILYKLKEKEGIVINNVITGKDLKTTYKSFEKRRVFINTFSLILTDDSLVTTLPKLLGSKAYNKITTTPIPIKTRNGSNSKHTLSETVLYNSIKKIYLNKIPAKVPRGTTMNIHLGALNWFTNKEMVENIESITKFLLSNKQYSLRTILLKSNFSPALPLFFNEESIKDLYEKEEASEITNEHNTIEIDGVTIELSNFNKALLEISNPDELSTVFSKEINKAKKRKMDEENQKIEEESQKSKKSKKNES
ncbi:Cic1p SCDLUD_004834 [Saccharomycodes ludwigii]|uniref:Cic1p n=1 Tax=Saccharomycodes ludwigii TaxID=36035 RepID=UPI001E84C3EE|nr:hypothetical protein SCDLUD_004834 [Saccharomycodes ludwigii]KAH3899391.1 hypothetical protein SCDLUD_004834 [Saccharomycodes ludwigii]